MFVTWFRLIKDVLNDTVIFYLCYLVKSAYVARVNATKGLNVNQCIFYLPAQCNPIFFLFLNIYLTYFVITVFPIYTHVHHNLICFGLNYSTSLEKIRHVVTFYISLTSLEKHTRKMTSQTSKYWSFFIFFM